MTTERFLAECADIEYRKCDSVDPEMKQWTLSLEGEIVRFANEILADEDGVLNRIEGQRFVG